MMFGSKELSIFKWFYPLFFVVCFFQAMNLIPPGLPGEGKFIWPFRLFMLYMGIKAFKGYKRDISIINIYLGYSLVSIFFYLINGYPLSLYIQEVAFFLPAFLFVYIGHDSTDVSDQFYKYSLWAIITMFAVGLFLYFIPPSWYQAAWIRRMENKWYLEGMNVTYEHIAENMRFSSFMLTSYATEYFGIFALPFSLYFMSNADTRKTKSIYIICALVSITCIVLSLQRSAMLAAILVLFFYAFYDIRHNGRGVRFYMLSAIIVCVLISMYANTELGQRIFERFDAINIEDAFNDSRIEQNQDAYTALQNIIFGNGIGTCGAAARRLGLPAVSDSNYMKLLVEQGIIGLILFFSMIIATLKRVASNYKCLFPEGAIVASYLIAMIGSNALSFSLYSPLFWFAIGRIWNEEYIYNLKYNNKSI